MNSATLENSLKQDISVKGAHIELGLVLDRSASMISLADTATGAFNLLLSEQRKLSTAPATGSLLLFDSAFEFLVDGRPLNEIPNLVPGQNYRPEGGTALLDATGAMIERIGERVDGKRNIQAKVLIVVITDGQENSSHRYNFDSLKEIITYRQRICGWQFILISPKAATTAFKLGVPLTNTLNWKSTPEAVERTLACLSKGISSYRLGEPKWRTVIALTSVAVLGSFFFGAGLGQAFDLRKR